MQHFLYQLHLVRQDLLDTRPTNEEAQVIQDHFDYLREHHTAGTVLLAGRTDTSGLDTFGVVVIQCEDETQASEIVRADPAVARQVMTANLFPFRLALF